MIPLTASMAPEVSLVSK
jgi:hypothetical protein